MDSYYVFEYVGEDIPDVLFNDIWDDSLRLLGYSLAAALPGEQFQEIPAELPAGTVLRVILYWDVVADMGQNYTVFVHALNEQGNLLGQHDSWPADQHRPTSILAVGDKVRDVHYLTINEPVSTDSLTLRMGLYESIGGKTLTNSAGQLFTEIAP